MYNLRTRNSIVYNIFNIEEDAAAVDDDEEEHDDDGQNNSGCLGLENLSAGVIYHKLVICTHIPKAHSECLIFEKCK